MNVMMMNRLNHSKHIHFVNVTDLKLGVSKNFFFHFVSTNSNTLVLFADARVGIAAIQQIFDHQSCSGVCYFIQDDEMIKAQQLEKLGNQTFA